LKIIKKGQYLKKIEKHSTIVRAFFEIRVSFLQLLKGSFQRLRQKCFIIVFY